VIWTGVQRQRSAPRLTKAYAQQVGPEHQPAKPAMQPGRVSAVILRHERWCDALLGRGLCSCNPDLEMGSDPFDDGGNNGLVDGEGSGPQS